MHERVLDILGSAALSREDVERLLAACAEAFDVAKAVRKTPFLMAFNISDFARPIVIGGGQELIDQGFHREAMVWIAFMHTLCCTALQNDAREEVVARFAPGYHRLLVALGVPTHDDLMVRREQIGQLVPELWRVTEHIVETNPAISD